MLLKDGESCFMATMVGDIGRDDRGPRWEGIDVTVERVRPSSRPYRRNMELFVPYIQ